MKRKVSKSKIKSILWVDAGDQRAPLLSQALQRENFSIRRLTLQTDDTPELPSSPPHLILIYVDPRSKLWQNWLAAFRKIKSKAYVPVLGYAYAYLESNRALGLRCGCDNVVSLKALLNHPHWQVNLHARPIDIGNPQATLPAGVIEGILLFNSRKFHEAHDAIEPIWLKERDEIRLLYQGILQAGIGYYHIEKGNSAVALRMFIAAKTKLRHFLPLFQGVNLQALYQAMTKSEELLKKLGPHGISRYPRRSFPKIEYPLNME